MMRSANWLTYCCLLYTSLAWVSNAYILGLTVVVPFSAWLSQRCGPKRLFLLSLGLFSLGALASGLAHSLGAVSYTHLRLTSELSMFIR